MKAAIFDLDGVLADTAKYHYLAWKKLADKLGFEFTPEHNERLKGVSRTRSLEILLEVGGLTGKIPPAEQERMASEKNALYVEYISNLGKDGLLPGAEECLRVLKARGVKVALGSASKNARVILDGAGITPLFDAISDGTRVSKPKPDPEVFTLAADDMGVAYRDCAVFEDSAAGIEAALAAGMTACAIGNPADLPGADAYFPSVAEYLKTLAK